jgi:hypothetical protein
MVRTGASSYIRYDWEDTFGTAAFNDSTDKAFGLQQRLTSWTLNHSRKDLPQLNQVEVKDFAYGQQNGSLGIDFVLSNPWVFTALYGATTTTGSGPYVHTWGTTGDISGAKTITPFSVEVGFAAEGPPAGSPTNIVRQAKGCILNSLNIGCGIDETVNCSADISYGSETDNGTTYHSSPPTDDVNFPYTFAHGELRWYDSGGDTDAAGSVVAQLQSANVSFAQNSALLYGIGSHRSVSAFRRVFDITGSFTASWVDNRQLLQLLDQIEKPLTKSTIRSGVAGAAVDAVLTFDNGGSGVAKKAITLKLSGVSPDSISIDGIQPVEPVFENIAWRAKTASVVADNNISTAL